MRKDKIILLIIYLVLVFSVVFFAGASFYYKILYQEAIKQGAENTVTAIQMVTACTELGNFTQDEIIKKTIDMFVLNKEQKGK